MMNEKEFVHHLVNVLESLRIPYFITGDMAAIAYGEPRYTNDVDIVVDLNAAMIPAFAAFFPSPDYYLSESAMRDAVAKRFQFNILHPASGLNADIIIPSTSEYDRLRQTRLTKLEIDSDLTANFASKEDVIRKKLEYFQLCGSEKHLRHRQHDADLGRESRPRLHLGLGRKIKRGG